MNDGNSGDVNLVLVPEQTEAKPDKEIEEPANTSIGAVPATASFTTPRKLVDYSSGSESKDSESDSSDSSVEEPFDCEKSSELSSEEDDIIEEIRKPIEEVTITAPADQCKEVGKVKNILNNQVVVEPNLGLAALDLDTVLFLDNGNQPFGRVDDVFGPITEPLYSVLLPSAASVAAKGIVAGMKVYYAPSMSHTSYIFLPDLIKMKGSDASWKHNQEAPAEFQDFSDDEEEAKARGQGNTRREPHRQGKPRFNKKRNRDFSQRAPAFWTPPNWSPHVITNSHPSPMPFNPYAPPPGYSGDFGSPYIFPPPMTVTQPPPPPPPSQQPQQSQVQDMRHWNKN